MGNTMDNLRALARGVPVPGNAGDPAARTSPVLEGSSHSGSVLRGEGIQQNSKKKLSALVRISPKRLRDRGWCLSDATLRFVATSPVAPRCRGWSRLRSSLGCVNLGGSASGGDLRPALQRFTGHSTDPGLRPLPFAREEGPRTPFVSVFPARPLGTETKGFQRWFLLVVFFPV